MEFRREAAQTSDQAAGQAAHHKPVQADGSAKDIEPADELLAASPAGLRMHPMARASFSHLVVST